MHRLAWGVLGLVVLISGCDSVLSLERARPRPSTKRDPVVAQMEGDAAVPEGGGAAPSCSLEGGACGRQRACCAPGVCSAVTNSCTTVCSTNADCESGCCASVAGSAQALCSPARECAAGGAGGAGDAGTSEGGRGPTGTTACLAVGASCGASDACCDGLCVEYGQGAGRCESTCKDNSDCATGCCREFKDGLACVTATACEQEPCGGNGKGYRYWCADDHLHVCYDGIAGAPELAVCAGGCVRGKASEWDQCAGTDPCRGYPKQGGVCGSTLGGNADPKVLYNCVEQATVSMESCSVTCRAGDPTHEDACE